MKKVVFFLAVALMSFAAKAQITTFPWTEGFEGSSMPSNITLIDNDNDGRNWMHHINTGSGNFSTHGGNGVVVSASYESVALTPDNWMILPAFTLPANATGFNLTWWAVGQDASWAAEHYSVYVATSNTVAAFTATNAVYDGVSTATYTKQTVDLSSYAGQTIYIAFRHWNISDMFYLNIDDIRVGGPELPTLTLAGPSSVAMNNPITYTATTEATSTIAWYVDGVQQSATTATFTHTFTSIGTYTVKVGATNTVGTVYDSVVVTVVDGTVTSFPWLEDFESVALDADGFGEAPAGWTVYADNNTNYSSYAPFGQGWVVADLGAGASAYSTSYLNSSSALCDRWLVTPQLNMPSATGYYLEFDLYGRSDSYPESLKVMVSTTNNAKTSFTTTIYNEAAVAAGTNHKAIDLSAYAGQNIYIAFVNYGTNGYIVGVDNVKVSIPAPYGIAYLDGMVQGFAPMGTSFNFYTLVENQGINPMTSYTLTYTLNNGTPQTRNVTGINVAPFDSYIDTVTISYPTTGALTIGLEVSAPNGQTDPNPSDNTGSLTTTIYDPATATQRMTLLEHFTTAVCPNCPPAHTRLDNVMEGFENQVAWVAHHVGYYTDNYTLTEDESSATGIMGFYTGTSSFAPGMLLDRDPENVPGEYNGIVGGVDNEATLQSQFNNAINKPAFVTVGLQNVIYDASTRQVSFDVNGAFTSAITGDVRLTVYITEDSLIGTQSGATGNYRHDHVLRAVITDYWGDALTSTNANDTYSKHYTYTLPATWNYGKCRLTAFVNMYSNSFSNRKVLNATKSSFLSENLGIEDVKPAISVKMWPNPVAEMAFVEAESTIRSYEVVNALGQRVMGAEHVNASALELNVSGLAAGVYFVSVTTDNGVSTERLSVVK